jgi:hypothetical protein
MKKVLLSVMIMLVGALNLTAADTSKTYEVGPGKNGSHWITQSGKVGDNLTVNFTPKNGYQFTRATQCEDQTKADWQRRGPHTFQVQCVEKHHKEDQRAVFSGAVRAEAQAGQGAPPAELPWDLAGFFKVLGEHEGVGDDMGRGGAGLTSSKPGGAPIPKGEATYDPATGQFIGSFSEGEKKGFTGVCNSGAHRMKASRMPCSWKRKRISPARTMMALKWSMPIMVSITQIRANRQVMQVLIRFSSTVTVPEPRS